MGRQQTTARLRAVRERQHTHDRFRDGRGVGRSESGLVGPVVDARDRHILLPPRVSVVLCTYNRCNLVLSTLATLRRQTLSYEQFEVIVIDNGSSDGTINAVHSYVHAGPVQRRGPADIWRVHCLSEPRNGLSYARSTGLRKASGEIVVFLDDDTLADPFFLEHLLNAYDETGADAIGPRVVLRWEAPRPHWLTDDLLDVLGFFAPYDRRAQLPPNTSFSSSCFSLKMEVLRALGPFQPFLSKRLHVPARMEVTYLCQCMRKQGYSLWYEPGAVVAHRAAIERLQRPFFVGRAYWQGRSEALMDYAASHAEQHEEDAPERTETSSLLPMLYSVVDELREIAGVALVHRPLLFLAKKSTNEQLLAAMAHSYSWGYLQQQLHCIEHAPADMTMPAVLLVAPSQEDVSAALLARAYLAQGIPCTTSYADLPLSWLWRHRAYQGQAIGIVHFYRPGAFNLSHQQYQRLWLLIWFAHRLGLRIVTTDTGGWWQNMHSLRFLARRSFERRLIHCSDIVLAHTRQPDQLYPDKKLRHHVRCLPHPGFRGYYPEPVAREQAHRRLGLPRRCEYVYLCFANMHTERELLHLIDAFTELGAGQQRKDKNDPQLLLIGTPRDKKVATQILQRAAVNSALHLFMPESQEEQVSLYMGAADAVVLPHFAQQSAGVLETALIALSHERIVIAPNLPRFSGMLPPRASLLYEPSSRASLVQALRKAQALKYYLKPKEAQALEAEPGWRLYANRLLDIYKQLLSQ